MSKVLPPKLIVPVSFWKEATATAPVASRKSSPAAGSVNVSVPAAAPALTVETLPAPVAPGV
jgi:hypothetical protein